MKYAIVSLFLGISTILIAKFCLDGMWKEWLLVAGNIYLIQTVAILAFRYVMSMPPFGNEHYTF